MINNKTIERIDFLKNNAELGIQPFMDEIKSNCFGTACYTLGIDSALEKYYAERLSSGNIPFLDYSNMNKTDKVILPPENDRPGFFGRLPFKLAVEDQALFEKTWTPNNYDLVLYKQKKDGLIRHAAIFLENNFIFHQNNMGGLFEIIHFESYKHCYPTYLEYYKCLI